MSICTVTYTFGTPDLHVSCSVSCASFADAAVRAELWRKRKNSGIETGRRQPHIPATDRACLASAAPFRTKEGVVS